MAIPIAAIKKVERVNFELHFKQSEKEKQAKVIENQFEVFLKDGFLDLYLKPDYESK